MKTNFCQNMAISVVKYAIVGSIKYMVKPFHKSGKYKLKLQYLSHLPTGTVGRKVADLLIANKLELIPDYESHDLKHVLLNYDMHPEHEVRMQICMLGNGNYSFTCFAMAAMGLLMPSLWPVFKEDYRKGKNLPPIKNLRLDDYAHYQLHYVQEQLFCINTLKFKVL